MRARVLLLSAVVLSALCPSVLWAADGVLLVQSVDDGASTTATTSQVQMDANRIRTEIHDGDAQRQVVIFDSTKNVLFIVDPVRQSYIEMTQADAAKVGGMMQGAMAMMQEQLAQLPPAQRAMMEEKMGAMMGGGAAAALPEYKRNGSGMVGGRACDRYDGYTAGEKTSEICTVAPEALGLEMGDFAVMPKLIDFIRSIQPQMASQIVGIGTEEQGFAGLPIRTATTDPGSGRTITMTVTDARRATFEDSIFEVPAGYQKQALLPSMGQ